MFSEGNTSSGISSSVEDFLKPFFLNDTGTFYLLFTKGSPAKFIRDKGCSLPPRAKISLLHLTLVPSSFGG